ncbi:hypothetical protein H6F64_02780 [Phormidium sp. FACHB-77]|nr:hypothetical protein [Phormidium sp. FACHB-77]
MVRTLDLSGYALSKLLGDRLTLTTAQSWLREITEFLSGFGSDGYGTRFSQ